MTKLYILVIMLVVATFPLPGSAGEYRGQLSANPYAPNSVSNPYGQYGSPYSSKSLNNPYGAGNPYSNQTQKLYDSEGNYRGKITNNPYDPDSISNPHGRYGNPYSPDSINNPYGAGNPYRQDSPTNPYGSGLNIYDND